MSRSDAQSDSLFPGFIGAVRRSASTRAPSARVGEVERPGALHLTRPSSYVERASQAAEESTRQLAYAARHGSVVDQQAAHVAIAGLLRTAIEPYGDQHFGRGAPRVLLARVERSLGRMRRWIPVLSWPDWLLRAWTLVGLGLTVTGALFVYKGAFLAAAGVFAARAAASLTMPTPGFPSDSSERHRSYIDWRACVAGHFADALSGTAVALHLANSGQHGLATMIAGAAPVLMLSGTMTRLAAAQGGVVLGRLRLERVARNATLLGGLLMSTVSGSTWWLLAGPGGTIIFALFEVLRTASHTRFVDDIEGSCDPKSGFPQRAANVIALVARADVDDEALEAV